MPFFALSSAFHASAGRLASLPASQLGSALGLGGGLGGVHSLCAHGVEIGFSHFSRLLGSLVGAFVGVVGSGDSRLHQSHGAFRAGGGVLDGVVHQGQHLLLAVGQVGFGGLGEIGTSAGHDVIDMAAVRSGLFGSGLQQAGLQSQQLLRVLDRQRGGGRFGGFAQRGLCDLQVQLDELLDAFEGLGGEAEQGLDAGLLGGHELISGEGGGHENLLRG